MADFIEYVVAELHSKRLSKTDAMSLVRQFAGRAPGASGAATIHPLLHTNTSDLSEQRYRSTFTGEEFFLVDHQVTANGDAARKVLPGVVYLEMARAAIEHALPARVDATTLELRHTVWAHPVVVAEATRVSIALIANDEDEIDYEIYSDAAEDGIVHCRGRAVVNRQPAPARLDLEQLRGEMRHGEIGPDAVYATCARMGLIYGPSFHAITVIHRGVDQVLAQLRLPAAVAQTAGEFVLHPSLMDGALQAAVGLIDSGSDLFNEPRLPFALDGLRVVSPCTPEMVAWVRHAPGSGAASSIVRLDLDLCDAHGNVCVEMRGLSSRVLSRDLGVAVAGGETAGTVAHATPPAAPPATPLVVAAGIDPDSLAEKTQEYLRRHLSELLKVPFHQVDPGAALEQYGIDSILAMRLTERLEETFGSLSKTLFFEYQTIRELSDYFLAQHATRLATLFAATATRTGEGVASTPTAVVPAQTRRRSTRRSGRLHTVAPNAATDREPIAIVGLSGRYPGAVDIEAYWHNLREGTDCISEVPKERWDWREYFSDDRSQTGRHFSKWGGFIAGVDEFDPLFFNISPVEAEHMDPQERLFLQHAWMAIEDAGYTRASLQMPSPTDLAGQVGVYVGVMYSEYQLFGAEAGVRGKRVGIPGSVASIANRVSYVLNLHGPSMTLDTMCSSSLSAIHLACDDLRRGRTSMAIAGGVNVSIHPAKYLVLSAGHFISTDGHCQSFGEGGDGYIPGEGVGVVVLKRLSEAKRDGDHIYALIRGSALNHGGKTNGYTVPNPHAQTSAISRALTESHTDARAISYIEAHGTGTRLGDPIEIAALSKAFQPYSTDTAFCAIGSVKSNIGHCESAAGIAGLTKVLLQMQHRQIVPSLHSTQLNAHIDFDKTPFVVNQTLKAWESPVIGGQALPRIAGLSSFGAGGSNAHMIVEEYHDAVPPAPALAHVVIPLSARTPEQLQQRARDLVAFIRPRVSMVDLTAMAYTLQVGRETMDERLGLVVSSVEQLVEKLDAYVAGVQGIEDVYEGRVTRQHGVLSVFSADADLQHTVDKWIANNKLAKLVDLWAKGLELDWRKLYGAVTPSRLSLPTYPFAHERYWIDTTATAGHVRGSGAATAFLHPLLHSNTSDLNAQRYRSTFTGDEFFLADHRVRANGDAAQKMLPGVAYLEMARAAIERALPSRLESTVLELRNTAWVQPLIVGRDTAVHVVLVADDDHIDYEIRSADADQEIVYCQGRALASRAPAAARLDVAQLTREMTLGDLDSDAIYATCARLGMVYGPAFQGVAAIHRGNGQVLAHLRLPDTVANTAGDFVLHPSMMDSALQAAVGLLDGAVESTQLRVPFALDTVRIFAPCTPAMLAWVRYAAGSQAADHVVKLDIDVCDSDGNVCVQMHGLSSRGLSREASPEASPEAGTEASAEAGSEVRTPAAPARTIGTLLAVPVWHPAVVEAAAHGGQAAYTEHHVVLCDLPAIDTDALAASLSLSLPLSECVSLRAEPQQSLAQRYSDHALACFDRIQAILRGKPKGKALVQIVVVDDHEHAIFAGLSALLKTATLENPKFVGQLILVAPHTATGELGRLLQAEQSRTQDAVITHARGVRQVLRWQEVEGDSAQPPIAFADRGVYLITGGLGGLGLLFAREILEQTTEARVILTGRSALRADTRDLVDSLSGPAGQVIYRQVDVGDGDQVTQLIADIIQESGRLTGILHSAGTIADSFILKKTGAEFRQVLAPKVTGACNLDQASRDVDLDFFVVFSSLAGALGNVGQADYATANGFLDQFAAYRNRLVITRERHGRTRSINWPLWQAGGMHVDRATQEWVQKNTGMRPMQTAAGLHAFYRALASPHDQMLVVDGDLAQLRRVMLGSTATSPAPQAAQTAAPEIVPARAASDSLVARTEEYLRTQFADLLKIPARKLDPQAALETYGIDSILAMTLTNELEKTFGSLSKTLFFEYQTIAALAGYFAAAHPAIVQAQIGVPRETQPATIAERVQRTDAGLALATRGRRRVSGFTTHDRQDIAIVGLAGRYPQADTLQEFWRNLQNGRDCITEIPLDRWDHTAYYDPDPARVGKTYSKWGGFIGDVDKFDPLFFNMSPREAAMVDPQERLFLQTAWETIEDAGYTKARIAGGRVGVYVGVMWGQYELLGVESMLTGGADVPISSHASIANRVSYFFDLHGPSIALDTMCSSSLTAMHLACEALRNGEIDAAIAGGVNVTIHPYKYLSLSQGKFVASDGKCRSFGEGGDGYVPGEGVGAVLLKPLADAVRDGDQIYAVIKSSTVNHGGKTNGYTVPNPRAQADLVLDALKKAEVDPGTLSYIETHGTGTSLGDPIEIAGLSRAFEGATEKKQFCPIGSVKSNIGHLESAAGIAAVTKALLQIRHNQLVPSLHADPLNPHINFTDSPFYVQTALTDWPPAAQPRRVGVSSFGAGGSNAHLILQEYALAPRSELALASRPPEVFVLSAWDNASLRRYVERVVVHLQHAADASLADMAYTSQVGRTPMSARLAIIASSVDDLRTRLTQWRAQQDTLASGASELDDVFYGDLKTAQYPADHLIAGEAGAAFLHDLLVNGDLERLARFWVLGVAIDWSQLNRLVPPRKVSLPTYPFARERCWIQQPAPSARDARARSRTRHVGRSRTHTASPSTIAAARVQTPVEAPRGAAVRTAGDDAAALIGRTESYLKALIGEELRLAPDRIGATDRLESFGIDSVMITRLNATLETDLGDLPKTLLYEHDTVRELAAFLVVEVRDALIARFGSGGLAGELALPPAAIADDVMPRQSETAMMAAPDDDADAIAIIGIHGSYPHSPNLDAYWENLKQGKELIDPVPPARWDAGQLYHPDPAAAADGKIYCKWGGFLDDYDKFDPRFFNITPDEARLIDPQERLFLESVWAAIEDAGYTRDTLRQHYPKGRSADVGVFVGVTTNSYQLWASEEGSRGHHVSPSAMPWSIANRVSYVFDFSGPSMPVDTACSSSSVALHLACESLRHGDCRIAVAGGVNLYLHPAKYLSLCQSRMLSRDGACRSYGAGGEGFVPGEGVGTFILKPLDQAVADRDRIHAVIRGSGYDHSGRSKGYSAPNPTAQASLISRTLEQAGIDADTIDYVEGHGTGTQLGDGLEVAALTKAFQTQTARTQFCALGSVKANIGHAESAAGVAGLAKVVLQIKHRQLAPSISSDEVNPDINFDESPLYLQHGLADWPSSPDHPRRALINSFGAGGVNACLVVEEYDESGVADEERQAGPYVFTLSARNEERLRAHAERLLAHARREQDALDLARVCYTLQLGREALDERLAIVVSDAPELIARLDAWIRDGSSSPGVHRGSPGSRRGATSSSTTQETVDAIAIANETAGASPHLTHLAAMWVAGQEVDWEGLYPAGAPRRIGLPTYPFARERYWVSDVPMPDPQPLATAHLHPLVSHNSSTLKEISFSSSLSDTAFYAVDHRVHSDAMFPGAGFLELACIAGTIAGERKVRQIRDIVWLRPLSFRTGAQTVRTVVHDIGGSIEYVISSFDEDNEPVVHSEGRLAFTDGRMDSANAEDRVPIETLKAQCAPPVDGAAYYEIFRKYGLQYGPAFQTLREVYVNDGYALSRLHVADHLTGDFGQFMLHPSIIDGAFQATAGLVGTLDPGTLYLPFALDEIEILGPVPQTCYAYAEWADAREPRHADIRTFNIRLVNESGDVLIRFKNLYVKALAATPAARREVVA
jgi:acyl transferase domain-containing protein